MRKKQRRTREGIKWLVFASAIGFTSSVANHPAVGKEPTEPVHETSRAEILSIAREVMTGAGFATLITTDDSGAPQARIMDPLPPTEELFVWMGTNPKSRKVGQIQADSLVALTYFVPSGPSYVTLHGQARLVDDAAEKARRWKKEWEPHYPDRKESLLLIEVQPSRLEIISVPHGLTGDPETWTPDRLDFPASPATPSATNASTPSPYSKLGPREIKALAPERIVGLEAGHGLGYAMAAELNRYPGPKHAIELAETLDLSQDQLDALHGLYDEMHSAAVQAGRELIEAERRLDRLFADATVDPKSLEDATQEAAAAEGRVRLAHLRAHLKTALLLDRHQTHLYYSARGYEGGAMHHPGH